METKNETSVAENTCPNCACGAASVEQNETLNVKRGRGRPRKTPLVVAGTPATTNEPLPVKRGRGRPRKSQSVAV